MDALSLDSSTVASADHRRQPGQSLPNIRGVIPENWLAEQLHLSSERATFNSTSADSATSEAMNVNDSAVLIDEWLMAIQDTEDIDGDQMDDNWELEQFGSTLTQDSATDTDGDQTPDWYEYAIGLDPHDQNERFTLQMQQSEGGQLEVRWKSKSGLRFRLYDNDNLTDDISLWNYRDVEHADLQDILAIEATKDDSVRRFYRVQLLPASND